MLFPEVCNKREEKNECECLGPNDNYSKILEIEMNHLKQNVQLYKNPKDYEKHLPNVKNTYRIIYTEL